MVLLPKKKKSLMQRLQSWLEGLPIGRGSRESRRSRKASHSAAPLYRCSEREPKRETSITARPGGKDRRENRDRYPIPVKEPVPPVIYTEPVIYADPWDRRVSEFPMGGSLSQSFTRKTIRTNPWIRDRDRSSMRSGRPDAKMERSDCSFSSMDRSQLRVKSFGDSVCSSGYGSQDSSPESSVHSPNWQSAREDKAVECRSIDVDEALGLFEDTSSFGPYDNLMRCDSEEHIYHELESLNRFSQILDERSFSDSECSPSCSSSLSRPPSPIYARPYDGPMARPYVEDGPYAPARGPYAVSPVPQPPNLHSLPRGPYSSAPQGSYSVIPRPRMLPVVPHSAAPRRLPPIFCPPPPPPLPCNIDEALEQAENDFLAELDAQIAELQLKSEAVRSLVDEARGRRARTAEGDAWCRARWQNPRFELRL